MVEMKHKEQVERGFYAPEHGKHFHCAPDESIVVPQDVVWRAEAHGFYKVRKPVKPIEPEEVAPKTPKPKKKRKR